MDREFNCLIPDFPEVKINPTAKIEHVPEIGRKTRFIKDRARSIRTKLPFKRLPKIIIIDLTEFFVVRLNAFPVKSGV